MDLRIFAIFCNVWSVAFIREDKYQGSIRAAPLLFFVSLCKNVSFIYFIHQDSLSYMCVLPCAFMHFVRRGCHFSNTDACISTLEVSNKLN